MAVSKFKATCLKVLSQIKVSGETLVITKNGHPLALITPPPPIKKKHSLFGTMKQEMKIEGDIMAPLGTDDWDVFNR